MWFVIGFFCGAGFIAYVLPEVVEVMYSQMQDFLWKYKSMSDREKKEFHKDEEE